MGDAYRTSYDLAKHYRDEVIPLRRKIFDETHLRINGMLLSVFELLADSREQDSAVNSTIDALKDFWIAQTNLGAALGEHLPAAAANASQEPTQRESTWARGRKAEFFATHLLRSLRQSDSISAINLHTQLASRHAFAATRFDENRSLLVLLLSLTGCTTTKMADQPLLSPREGIASFKQLGCDEWAADPFIRTGALCGAEKIHLSFSEINVAILSLRQSKLTLATGRKDICSATHAFLLKDAAYANRIVLAANSLGAGVKYLINVD